MSTEATVSKRYDDLSNLGMRFNGQEYLLDDINVHWTEISCLNSDEWNDLIIKLGTEIGKRQKAVV